MQQSSACSGGGAVERRERVGRGQRRRRRRRRTHLSLPPTRSDAALSCVEPCFKLPKLAQPAPSTPRLGPTLRPLLVVVLVPPLESHPAALAMPQPRYRAEPPARTTDPRLSRSRSTTASRDVKSEDASSAASVSSAAGPQRPPAGLDRAARTSGTPYSVRPPSLLPPRSRRRALTRAHHGPPAEVPLEQAAGVTAPRQHRASLSSPPDALEMTLTPTSARSSRKTARASRASSPLARSPTAFPSLTSHVPSLQLLRQLPACASLPLHYDAHPLPR